MYKHVWAEIDLNALEYNLKEILKIVPANKAMGVVKANAYGHGAKAVATTLLELGVNKLPRLTTPAKVEGGVPNVLGMGIVEALSVLEEAGYNVQISGHGYVKEQTPQGGAELTAGSVVKLKLTSD